MDKVYLQLFAEIARAVDLLSEQVLAYDKKKNDEKGAKTAEQMRDDFHSLYEKLNSGETSISRADYAKLLIGAMVVAQNMEQRIQQSQKVLQGYRVDTIPKLKRIMDESSTDEEAEKLAKEIFSNT